MHPNTAVQVYRLRVDEPKERSWAGEDTTKRLIRGMYISLETWVPPKMCIHRGDDAEGDSPVQEVKRSLCQYEVFLRQGTVGEMCEEVVEEDGFEVFWRE